MAKKDFSQIDAGRVYDHIAQATEDVKPRKPRRTYSAEEGAEYIEAGRTHGRKGLKLTRINMAFPPDLYDYVSTMARATGQTMTSIVNQAVRRQMEETRETYERARAFRQELEDQDQGGK